MKSLLFAAAAMLIAGTAMAQNSVTYDFNTDQSASFAVVQFGGGDSSQNFSFDYSTLGIPAAPNGTGTVGLRSGVNESVASADSQTFYPATTGIDISSGNWVLTFDFYGRFGDNLGSTTEFVGLGAQSTNTVPGIGSDGTDGFNYHFTIDGGSGTDYRYAVGVGTMANDNAAPNWWGLNETGNTGTNWTNFFPVVNASTAGSPGQQWVTVRLSVNNGGGTRSVAFKKPGDADFTTVSTIAGGTGSSAVPCFGHADYFTSVNPNQYIIFDNVVITEVVAPTDATNWNLYE